jgi:hypothetical protein
MVDLLVEMRRSIRRAASLAAANPWHIPCIASRERLQQAHSLSDSFALRSTIMETLVIKDLASTHGSAGQESTVVRSLSRDEMKLVQGGRAMSVLVDGRPGGVVDDFALNMAIFSGDIGVRVV